MNLNDLFEGTGLSPDTLASYKEKAGAEATAADKAGNFKKGDKRFAGVVKATKKQFDNDAKGIKEGVDNLNDDDWYEIAADTKSIVGTINQRPQGAVMGRPVKLPNGNYAVKGMQAKYMGLSQGMSEASGIDDTDTIGFSVNSEAAYTAVMDQFGDHIDHDETSGIMYVSASMWPNVEAVAFDADGEGATQDDGYEHTDSPEQGMSEARSTDDPFDDMVEDYLDWLSARNMFVNNNTREEEKASIIADLKSGVVHPDELDYAMSSNQGVAEAAKKGLYYNVNKRKAAGTSRDADSPKAPTAQAWKDAAKTAKNEGVAEGLSKRDQKDVDAIKAAIERLQSQLKQPNVDKSEIQSRISQETKRLALYKQGMAEAQNDYFKRRRDEEDRIAGTKAPAKRTPKQTDYEKKRKQQGVAEHKGVKHRYQMTHPDGSKMKFTATDDADAKRQAREHGAKSLSKFKSGEYNKVAEGAEWHGSDTDRSWYDGYKDAPVRVKVKNTSGMGGQPAGTYTVRSFTKVGPNNAEFTVNSQGREMTASLDLDNPKTYIDKNYDKQYAYDFYSGRMPITPRQAFNLIQVKKQPSNIGKEGVAEGYDEWRAQELEKLRTRHPEGTGSTPSKTLAKLMRIPGFSKVSPAEQHRVAKAVDGYLARDMSFDQALVLAQKKGVAEGTVMYGEPENKESFRVTYYDPKYDEQRTSIIKSRNETAALDFCSGKGYDVLDIQRQDVAEDIVDTVKRGIKNVKRGLKGWDKDTFGPGGEELGNPRGIVTRNKSYDDEKIKRLHAAGTAPMEFPFRQGDFAGKDKHSPGGLQQRVLDREMKKRGLGEAETGEGQHDLDAIKRFLAK
jgi:hypothetical protein